MRGKLTKRQEQIVEVAMRILATEGARRFTVQVLSSEIGVTGGAIYRHFESMESIVDAVIERMGVILFENFPPIASDPIDRLRLFFLDRACVIRDNPNVSRLLLSDNLTQACGAAYGERLLDFKRRTQRFIVDCLEEASQAGALESSGVTPQIGAILLTGAILALSHVGPRLAGEQSLVVNVWAALEQMLRNRRVVQS